MSSLQTQNKKEKVQVTIDETKIPKVELEDLIDDEGEEIKDETGKVIRETIWEKSGDFLNTSLWGIKTIAPIFYSIISEEAGKPEYADKDIRFTLKNYKFGVRTTNNIKFLWKVKNNPPSSQGGNSFGGSGSSGGFKPQSALEELFVGTPDLCNKMIASDPKSRWYYVAQSVQVNPVDGQLICLITLKRNRFIPQG